jgi:hypothetical protein
MIYLNQKKFLFTQLFITFFTLLIVSIPQTPVVASTFTIQTNFLSAEASWSNKNDESVNSSIILSPYRISAPNPGTNDTYTFVMSVGAYDTGTTPPRVIFGALSASMTSNYNLNHSSLAAFKALTTSVYASVIALETSLYNVRVQDIDFSWTSGTRDDRHDVTFIYSLNQGDDWQRLGAGRSITTGSSNGSLSISESIQGSDILVGLLFENTFNYNNDVINIINPTMTITYLSLTDQESSDQLTSEIVLYSPCGDEENQYFMITDAKKIEFINKYNRLTSLGQSIFQSTIIEGGFTAYQRYLYLIQSSMMA